MCWIVGWTKQATWRHHIGLYETVMNIFTSPYLRFGFSFTKINEVDEVKQQIYSLCSVFIWVYIQKGLGLNYLSIMKFVYTNVLLDVALVAS